MAIPPLAGFTVAVTADRRREEQVELLRRRGATVLEGPTVRTLPLGDPDALREAIDSLLADPPEVTVFLTALGARGLFAAADSQGLDLDLTAAVSQSTIVARGLKASGAATALGLDVAWTAPSERSAEVLERLAPLARRGARIAVQRDGAHRAELAEALAAEGADAVDIPVYRWELPDDLGPALRLVDEVCERRVDAVTFTSRPALQNLLAIADEGGRAGELRAAFDDRSLPVCVGPVCDESARAAGLARTVVPPHARLGSMIQALVRALSGRVERAMLGGAELAFQGSAVAVDGRLVPLSNREREVLAVLVDADGAVVPKSALLRQVWGSGGDEHLVEVTVARMRRRLGPAGRAIVTVTRRGYRTVV